MFHPHHPKISQLYNHHFRMIMGSSKWDITIKPWDILQITFWQFKSLWKIISFFHGKIHLFQGMFFNKIVKFSHHQRVGMAILTIAWHHQRVGWLSSKLSSPQSPTAAPSLERPPGDPCDGPPAPRPAHCGPGEGDDVRKTMGQRRFHGVENGGFIGFYGIL